MMLNGLCTNSDIPGTENMVTTWVDSSWLLEPAMSVDLNPGSGDLPPQKVFAVKGWNRAICALTCLFACFERADLVQAGCEYLFKLTPISACCLLKPCFLV